MNYVTFLVTKHNDDGLFISQSKNAKDPDKQFRLDNKEHHRRPMSTSVKLSHNSTDKNVY